MSEIDWDKPVECRYDNDGTEYYPVVFHGDNPDESKYCVVQRPNGHHFSVFFGGHSSHRFRNVRRMVKHRAVHYFNLFSDGMSLPFPSREMADSYALQNKGLLPPRVECREIVIEWETEGDE